MHAREASVVMDYNDKCARAGYAPELLLANLLAVNQKENITKRPPTLANIEDWIEKAKNKE